MGFFTRFLLDFYLINAGFNHEDDLNQPSLSFRPNINFIKYF